MSSLKHSDDILTNMSMMTSMPESIADHFANGVSMWACHLFTEGETEGRPEGVSRLSGQSQ
jgi:hypothetical protein